MELLKLYFNLTLRPLTLRFLCHNAPQPYYLAYENSLRLIYKLFNKHFINSRGHSVWGVEGIANSFSQSNITDSDSKDNQKSKMAIFWDIALCNLLDVDCLHHQGNNRGNKILWNNDQHLPNNILQHPRRDLHTHHCENLKFQQKTNQDD